jgi:precorrin-6Y C5,15-methyltransferase (decarboxylating)
MINRGINASAGMLIINPNARNTSRIGLSNEMLSRGSIHYVGSEIRAIILSKMKVDPQDDLCVIGGESIAIEAALIAAEGSVIAVEYSKADRSTLEDNVSHFDLHNIKIIDHVDEETMADCQIPSLVFLVASASTEQEFICLKKLNPNINAVIYTLDFKAAAALPDIMDDLGFYDVETIQVSVNKLGSNNTFKQTPSPWIITARGNGN